MGYCLPRLPQSWGSLLFPRSHLPYSGYTPLFWRVTTSSSCLRTILRRQISWGLLYLSIIFSRLLIFIEKVYNSGLEIIFPQNFVILMPIPLNVNLFFWQTCWFDSLISYLLSPIKKKKSFCWFLGREEGRGIETAKSMRTITCLLHAPYWRLLLGI